MDLSFDAYRACSLCPRACKVDRTQGAVGVCGCTAELLAARAALHYWEEPPISGEQGSGAIFFSGCQLRCVFCQNHRISHEGVGTAVSTERLAHIMCELEDQGALNINLVTPLHYAPHIRAAVAAARDNGLSLPIVCNTGGYENPQTVQALEDTVDIWLTDMKYHAPALAGALSGARDYPSVARAALSEMVRQLDGHGGRLLDADDAMRRGIIVRHLVLPGHVDDSYAVLDDVWRLCGNKVDLSVMNQYTPNDACRKRGGDLSRAVTEEEYEVVLCHADDLGFENIWWQQGGTVSESFVPDFDATGIMGAATDEPTRPHPR